MQLPTLALSHIFLSFVEQIFHVYCNISLRFSCSSDPKVLQLVPTTNLSSLPPRKKLDQMLGPFPLKFNLKEITKLFHLNSGCRTKSSKHILRSQFLPVFIQARLPSCPIGFHVLSATICSQIHGNPR